MRPKVTSGMIESLVGSGRGSGTLDQYQPWLMPHKSVSSVSSNISYVPMPMLQRHCYFLSRAERAVSHLLWWVGAYDVREQFPLWPWPHSHPMSAVDPERNWPEHPGMHAIAHTAGIPVYRYAGLPIDRILTIDLLVTVRATVEAPLQLMGISCKPFEIVRTAKPTDRVLERLELDRRYCIAAGIGHRLIHPERFSQTLIRQLDWLAPLCARALVDKAAASLTYQKFVDRLRKTAFVRPASEAIDDASRGLDWSPAQTRFAAHLSMWRLDVDVDLRQPLSMTSPLPFGGKTGRQQIRDDLLGGVVC